MVLILLNINNCFKIIISFLLLKFINNKLRQNNLLKSEKEKLFFSVILRTREEKFDSILSNMTLKCDIWMETGPHLEFNSTNFYQVIKMIPRVEGVERTCLAWYWHLSE